LGVTGIDLEVVRYGKRAEVDGVLVKKSSRT